MSVAETFHKLVAHRVAEVGEVHDARGQLLRRRNVAHTRAGVVRDEWTQRQCRHGDGLVSASHLVALSQTRRTRRLTLGCLWCIRAWR